MSESKPTQNNQKQKVGSIKAKLVELGVTNADLPAVLEKELAEELADATTRGKSLVQAAQEKAADLLVKAEENARKKILKPAHVCRALARLLTATKQIPDAATEVTDADASECRAPDAAQQKRQRRRAKKHAPELPAEEVAHE